MLSEGAANDVQKTPVIVVFALVETKRLLVRTGAERAAFTYPSSPAPFILNTLAGLASRRHPGIFITSHMHVFVSVK